MKYEDLTQDTKNLLDGNFDIYFECTPDGGKFVPINRGVVEKETGATAKEPWDHYHSVTKIHIGDFIHDPTRIVGSNPEGFHAVLLKVLEAMRIKGENAATDVNQQATYNEAVRKIEL